jgi:exosortase
MKRLKQFEFPMQSARASAASRQYVAFGFLFLLCLIFFRRSLWDTITLAARDEEYTHILLILPATIALICLEWKSLKFRTSWGLSAGFYLAALGSLIGFASRFLHSLPPDEKLALSILALIILWIAGFVLCFGTRTAQSMLFPLCFAFWMIPIPDLALKVFVRFLQEGSSVAAWLMFSAAGIPVSREGFLLSIPSLNIEVARECSSIRSSLILLVTTMLLAQLLLQTPWRKALLVALAVPLSLAKNGFRIFTIATLGTKVDPEFLTGKLHHDGGVLFFALALGAVFFLLGVLRSREAARTTSLPVGSRQFFSLDKKGI